MSIFIALAVYFGLACVVFYLRGVAFRRVEAAGKQPNNQMGVSMLHFILWPLTVPSLMTTLGKYPKVKR